jgi:ankyrin repeat protein
MQEEPIANSTETTDLTSPIPIPQGDSCPLLDLNIDAHYELMSALPLKVAVKLSMTSATMWAKSQPTLFYRALQESRSDRLMDGFCYLMDVISLSPELKDYPFNYEHLAKVLSRVGSMLDPMFKTDPRSAWKIALVLDDDELLDKLLGEDIDITYDSYGRGVMDYQARIGNLPGLKRSMARFHNGPGRYPFVHSFHDEYGSLPCMAAIGGHVHILKYLKKDLGYDLTRVFHHSDGRPDQTLLAWASNGGSIPTVEFLEAEFEAKGVDPYLVGRHLAVDAMELGNERVYYRHILARPEISAEETLQIGRYAVRNGNLLLAAHLIPEEKMPQLALDVILGGNIKIFWHYVDKGWLSLDQRFEHGLTIEHLLAQQGHLTLVKQILKRKGPLGCVYLCDDDGRSLLHHAALGGHRHTYSWLMNEFYRNRPLPTDRRGHTIAHTAAQAGNAWFLRYLYNANPTLLAQNDDHDNTILHHAAYSSDVNLHLMIIEEFHFDVRAINKFGNMPVHILALKAREKSIYWNAVMVILNKFGRDMLDIPGEGGVTIRELIKQSNAEEHINEIAPGLLESNPPMIYQRK